jgi:hypothetical protein
VAPEKCLTELDARGATPPNHLSAILAALATLPRGRLQFVRTKAQPVQLLRALVAQGVTAETGELPDGSWRTILRRAAANPSQ